MKIERDPHGVWLFDLIMLVVLVGLTALSLTNCTGRMENYSQILEPVGEPIAPGTAIVIAEVISYGGKGMDGISNTYWTIVRIIE